MTKDLVKIKGFSDQKVEKIKEACKKALVSPVHAFRCRPSADLSAASRLWFHDWY